LGFEVQGSGVRALGSPPKTNKEEANGWWEWPLLASRCFSSGAATITREIAVTPLKSSGMQAKTAPTIQKQPIQNYKVSLSI